jgi:8-oxo-dGTP pyrophosphatase MutT (NUDIX family)
MSRAQVIVVRDQRLLLVKHRRGGDEWWCLPGGGIEPGESPAAAALRELREECLVAGTLVCATSVVHYGPDDAHHTFLVDIGDQVPGLGHDPEESALPDTEKILAGLAWLSLDELSERDRVYLWTAGLLAVAPFATAITTWSRTPAVPPRDDRVYPAEGR